MKLKSLLFFTFLLFSSFIYADLDIPGYNISIGSNNQMRVFSMSNDKVNSRVIVNLKDIRDLESTKEINLDNLTNEEIKKLNNRIFNYIISKLDDSKIKHTFSNKRFFSAELSSSDYFFLDSLGIIESIEESMKLSTFMDETINLTNATSVWNLSYTGKNVGVCVIDTGVDYTHSDLGGCDNLYDNVSITYDSNISFESDNKSNLTNGEIQIDEINETGVDSISLFFSNITLNEGDYLAIYDKGGNEIEGISSNRINYKTINYSYDYLNITLFSNDFENYTQHINLTNYTTHNFEETCKKVLGGWDFVNNDYDAYDDNGHGTHVAGTISANGTIFGIAPGSHIIPVKVLNRTGGGNFTDVFSGVEYCINNKEKYNISVISMSLGGGGYDDYCDNIDDSHSNFKSLIDEAVEKNISVVVASGNNGYDTHISFPSCLSNTISVGSLNKTNSISSFSNRNWMLDVLSYGEDIFSLIPNQGYTSFDGTSMATPHVSGAISLYSEKMNRLNSSVNQDTVIDNFNRTEIFVEENGNIFPVLDIFSFFHSSNYSVTWNLNNSYYGPNNLKYIFGSVSPKNELLIQISDNHSSYWNGTNWINNSSKQTIKPFNNSWNYSVELIEFNSSENYTINLYDSISNELLLNHSFIWFDIKPNFSINSPTNNSILGPLNKVILINGTYNHSIGLDKVSFFLRRLNSTYYNGTDWVEEEFYFNVSYNEINKTFYYNLSEVNFNSSDNYSIKIKVIDKLNNFNTKSYNFFYDLDTPLFHNFSSYDEIKYLDNWSGIQINATDNFGISKLEINDTKNFHLNGTHFLNITDRLDAGNYKVNISIFDISNNSNWTIFNLNVTKSNSSVYTLLNNQRNNLTFEYDNSNILINSSLINGEFGMLNLTVNGLELNHSNSSNISYNYTFNTLGTFNVTTYYFNSTNFDDSYESLNFSIIDSISPKFIDIPKNKSIIYNENSSWVNFNASDNYELDSFSINNSNNFSINNSGYLIWDDKLSVGDYFINVTINDSSGNSNWTIYNLNISKSNSSVKILINGSRENLTLDYGEDFLIESKLMKGEFGMLNFTINRSEFNHSNSENISFIHSFNELGTFNLSTNYISNKNFNESFDSLTISIEDRKPPRLEDIDFNLPIIYDGSNKYDFKTYLFDPDGINKTKIFIRHHSESNFSSSDLSYISSEGDIEYWHIDIQDFVNSTGNYTYYFWAEDNEGNFGNISSISSFSVKENLSNNEKQINESNYTVKEGFNSLYTSDVSEINEIRLTSNDIVSLDLLNNVFTNKLKLRNNVTFYHSKNHSLTIFDDTELSFDENSDKTFNLPHSVELEDGFFGSDKKVTSSFSVGSNYSISLNKPSKILFKGEKGKNLIWMNSSGDFYEVKTYCDDLENPSNVNDICFIDSEDDLIVFTNHFSTFVLYEDVETETGTDDLDSSSPSGSSLASFSSSEDENISKSEFDHFDYYERSFIDVDEGINYFRFSKNSTIDFISLNSNESVKNISILYGEFDKVPKNINSFSGDSYQVMFLNSSFDFDLFDYNFKVIRFYVNSSWIDNFSYDDFNYSLFHYSDGWIPLEAKLINKSDSNYYFASNISSLGYYLFSVSERESPLIKKDSIDNKSLHGNNLEYNKDEKANKSVDQLSTDYETRIKIKGEYLLILLLFFISFFMYKIYTFDKL
ncbi:MAG: S8 family serine peptidase [Candidatus Woesearchaeota archaeon]